MLDWTYEILNTWTMVRDQSRRFDANCDQFYKDLRSFIRNKETTQSGVRPLKSREGDKPFNFMKCNQFNRLTMEENMLGNDTTLHFSLYDLGQIRNKSYVFMRDMTNKKYKNMITVRFDTS